MTSFALGTRRSEDPMTRVLSLHLPDEEIGRRTSAIHRSLAQRSPGIAEPDDGVIEVADLEALFAEYDRWFFAGAIRALLESEARHGLSLRVSRRMTRAGGKTARFTDRRTGKTDRYEIAVSETLLFQSFRKAGQGVRVSGLVCNDRIEALQRIMEHEFLHLVEFLVWGETSCSAENFRELARRFFGHTDFRHQLLTPREIACREHGIHVGNRVRFEFEGTDHTGFVNRITRRATVLVEDPRGAPFSDGKRYTKFYIPLSMLTRVQE